MRKTNSFLFIGALIAVAQESWQKDPGLIMSGGASGASGIKVKFGCIAKPPRADILSLVGTSGVVSGESENVVSRFVLDGVHRQYFGYDISAEATAVTGQYRVTIAPLTWNPKGADSLTPVLLPKYPAPQIVSEGDTLELDLLVSPDGKQKVVDYIQVEKKPEARAATSTDQPKDYMLDDGPVNFDFERSEWKPGAPCGFTRSRALCSVAHAPRRGQPDRGRPQ